MTASILAERLAAARRAVRPRIHGRITSVLGLTITVTGVQAAMGEIVHIYRLSQGGLNSKPILAEVISVSRSGLTCMPLAVVKGLSAGDFVEATGWGLRVPLDTALVGRVLNGLGQPIDGGPDLDQCHHAAIDLPSPPALSRSRITQPLGLGVRALDTLATAGRGQRFGIFAGSGVGKSSLLSMIARGTQATITVVALIGERGREVREFIDKDLGPEGLSRSVVVVATADDPAVVRLRAGFVATRIAEWFRDQGLDVVLMMDSLTRIAMAQREIGLSAGEPSVTRGYPPSTFSLLPQLLERAGPGATGSITGIYTVLVEADNMHDSIGDTARSILDGHVVLSRDLATAGHFPSIDVLESLSRVASSVITPEQKSCAAQVRRLLAARRDVKELVEIGAYVPGTNPVADAAIALSPALDTFLQQDLEHPSDYEQAWNVLQNILQEAA